MPIKSKVIFYVFEWPAHFGFDSCSMYGHEYWVTMWRNNDHKLGLQVRPIYEMQALHLKRKTFYHSKITSTRWACILSYHYSLLVHRLSNKLSKTYLPKWHFPAFDYNGYSLDQIEWIGSGLLDGADYFDVWIGIQGRESNLSKTPIQMNCRHPFDWIRLESMEKESQFCKTSLQALTRAGWIECHGNLA